jgi:hypothetical protein
MGNTRRKPVVTAPVTRRRKPAKTPEERENQLIAAAVNLAERQIEDGSASAQVVTHFLKLGSTRERMEQDKLRAEHELLMKRIETADATKHVEELYSEALNAMRVYSGQEVEGVEIVEEGYYDG